MFQNLDIFQTSAAMARHAGARQAVTVNNVANADTPDFQAMEIAPFKDTYSEKSTGIMRTTRTSHMVAQDVSGTQARMMPTSAEPSPNGNTVSIEEEMMKAVENSREHNRALAIYRHGMTVLRSTMGR